MLGAAQIERFIMREEIIKDDDTNGVIAGAGNGSHIGQRISDSPKRRL